ncbi:hypothetical protein [Streptomyces cinereoruber]|uniref:hypothetical protein n=1 Tax=Streptomyces cinereoruber TaxID=67260 RepID=UPI00363CC6AD
MPFPPGLPTVLVTYQAASPAGGGPAAGTVRFAPIAPVINLPDSGIAFTGSGTYRFDTEGRLVDADGNVGVRLLPCDIPGANPAEWVWLVTVNIVGAGPRSFYLRLSVHQTEVDLADVDQVDPTRAHYVVVPGPRGEQGLMGERGLKGDPGKDGSDATATPLGAAGAGPTIALCSDDPTTTDARTPLPHAATHGPGGSDPIDLSGLGATRIINATFQVEGEEGTVRHVLDGAANKIGFYGATPVVQQTVTGSWSDGTALASFFNALVALGLVADDTTA